MTTTGAASAAATVIAANTSAPAAGRGLLGKALDSEVAAAATLIRGFNETTSQTQAKAADPSPGKGGNFDAYA